MDPITIHSNNVSITTRPSSSVSPPPRLKRLRKKYDGKGSSSSSYQKQRIGVTLVIITFTIYFIGLFCSIRTLPPVNINVLIAGGGAAGEKGGDEGQQQQQQDVKNTNKNYTKHGKRGKGIINLSKYGLAAVDPGTDVGEDDDTDDGEESGGEGDDDTKENKADVKPLEEGGFHDDDDHHDDDEGNASNGKKKHDNPHNNNNNKKPNKPSFHVNDKMKKMDNPRHHLPNPQGHNNNHHDNNPPMMKSKPKPLPETSTVPKSIWPVTIRNEDGTYEDIQHPGNPDVTMTVPKFWSAPVHDQKLMSREKAMQIGTCITTPNNNNSKKNNHHHHHHHQRGDECPEKDRTVYVAIASYRDWQCRFTLESIFMRAKYPQRIRVGVVDQIVDGEDVHCDTPIKDCSTSPDQALCKYMDQVDVYQMDAPLSVGPVFARHVGHRMYRGEYYAMQSDAHVTFTQDWDVDIISQLESTGDDMAVLTTYLTDIQNSIDDQGHSLRKTRPIMCNTDYEGGAQGQHLRHLSQPEGYPSIHGMPQLEPYWAAGFSFSRGHFVVNVPYDFYQPMIFQGEEMSIGIRGFTIGYDFFAMERSVCFHHYSIGKNEGGRGKVKHFWENSNKYKGTGKKAMARLLGIVHMNPETDRNSWLHDEEDRYGLGTVRTPEQFYHVFGIDVARKTTKRNLCQFVERGKMHNTFMKLLRSDGMGIDYTTIDKPFQEYM